MCTFFACPQCGVWTPVAWHDAGGTCTTCFFTTRVLLERFARLTHSRWFKWHGWLVSLTQRRKDSYA
jgi:hypothetical protein